MVSTLLSLNVNSDLDIMNIFYYVTIFSIFLWLLVPLRQVRRKYFYFFLFVSLTDLFTLALRILFRSPSNFFILPFFFLALISIQDIDFIKKNLLLFILLFIFILFYDIFITINKYQILLLVCLQLLIILKIAKDFFVKFMQDNQFDIFVIVLFFFEILEITKFLNLLIGFTHAYIYFYITTAFEILIGLFFCIFRSDDQRLVLQLK